jgi:hypothetical protein
MYAAGLSRDLAACKCTHCAADLGAGDIHETPARVLGVSSMQPAVFVEARCSQCEHHMKVDGAEYLILRKGPYRSEGLGDFELCFTWELLNDMVVALTDDGTFFWAVWRKQMEKYDVGGKPVSFQDALQSIYRHFVQATLDFIELQQLPYEIVLRCQCALRHQHLISDGIMVCLKRGQIHMAGPWLPQQPGEGEPQVAAVYGSEYGQRFAIRDQGLRNLLRPLTTSAQDGWQLQQLIDLRQRCQAIVAGAVPDVDLPLRPVAAALLEVFGGNGLAPQAVVTSAGNLLHPHLRSFLRELSAHSPACQIVHASDLRPVVSWMAAAYSALAAEDAQAATEASRACTPADLAALRFSAPCIQACMAKVLGWAAQQQHCSLCLALLTLADALVEVRPCSGFCCARMCCACCVLIKFAGNTCPTAAAGQAIYICAPVMQASMACYEPKQAPAVLPGFQPREVHAATNRHVATKACVSQEEAYLRTGTFSGANPACAADKQQGKGRKRYPLFAADSAAARKKAKEAEDVCTKHKFAAGALSHGVDVCISQCHPCCPPPHAYAASADCHQLGRH